ncbi:hypothetical protein ACFVH0_24420 [Streptomyces sp. NPDC127117]|uniref:hypothetical protein n=1 Tax=Streptomyces sp. NPDC127117 TaxID=3345368 RepID=UPI0036301A72
MGAVSFLSGTAQAHEAVSGSLAFSGEAGEFVSGGQSQEFTAGSVEIFDVSGPTAESTVSVTVVTPEGKRWSLHLQAPEGKVDSKTGQVAVGGTATCNKPARISLSGLVAQTQKSGEAIGRYEGEAIDCTPGAPVPWNVTIPVTAMEPGSVFRPGAALFRGFGSADDRDYPVIVNAGDNTAQITLVKS